MDYSLIILLILVGLLIYKFLGYLKDENSKVEKSEFETQKTENITTENIDSSLKIQNKGNENKELSSLIENENKNEDNHYDILDEMVNNDEYRWPIQRFLCGHSRPLTIYDIHMNMQVNGYNGRYTIVPIRREGKLTNEIRIKIFMPDCKMYYMWPYKTTFLLDECKLKTDKYLIKKDYHQHYLGALMGITQSYKRIDLMTVGRSIGNDTKKVCLPIVDKIIELELGSYNGEIKLKTIRECHEIYGNLICNNYKGHVDYRDLPMLYPN